MATAKTRNAWGTVSVCVFVAFAAVSCAGSGFKHGIYTQPEVGYSIPDPNRLAPAQAESEAKAWSRTSIRGADLAYHGPHDAYMALSSHCDEDETRPALLARQLLVGLEKRKRLSAEEFEFAGGQAFRQSIQSLDESGEALRTRTVTLVRGGCVVDWVMVVPGSVPEVEETFDRWWQAFDPGTMPGAVVTEPEVTP